MKRVLTFLAIMLLPLSVWAMTPVTDSDLADVTGQAGVNINADLTMNIGIGVMAWGDADGVSEYWTSSATGYGYIGMTNFYINNLRIKARTTDNYNGYEPYEDTGAGIPNVSDLKPITIDVATDATLYGGRTFVRFGTGALQITMNELQFTVELGPDTGLGQEMGVVTLGAIGIYLNPLSYVDIYSHGGSGVTFTLDITVDEFQMDYVSWGDTDGLPGGNIDLMSYANPGFENITWFAPAAAFPGAMSAGYVGLDNLVIGGPIAITGTVAIDVLTTAAGIYAHGLPGDLTTYPDYEPVTVIHISFPSLFNLNVTGPITANVKLDSVAQMTGDQVLGDFYIQAFNLDIAGGSWVDIWAH